MEATRLATNESRTERNQCQAFNLRLYENMFALPLDCEDFFLVGEQDSFDLSSDWFRLLESSGLFPRESTRFYVPERENKVLGVLPLILRQVNAWTKQVESMTCFYSSLYRPLLSPSITSDELALCIRKVITDTNADVLLFDKMDPTHPNFDFLESAMNQAGLRPYRFFCFGNWYLPVKGRSFTEYFQGLGSKVRNTVKRRKRKFLDDGRGRLEIITGSDGLESLAEKWEKVYNASWKIPEPFPDFIPGLISTCEAHNWLRLGMAYYDGEPVAAQLWIVNHDRAAIYKLAYNKNFAYLSPGTILTNHLMRHVLDVDKVQEVDYLSGDDAYKKDWMSHRRERWGIVAYNLRTLGGLAGSAKQILGKIYRSLLKK